MEVSHPRIALERAGLLAAGTMSRLMMSELDNRSAFEIGDDFTQFAGRRAGSIDPDNGCLALARFEGAPHQRSHQPACQRRSVGR